MADNARVLGVLLLSAARHQETFAELIAAHPRLRAVAVADEPDAAPWVRTANRELAAKYGLPYSEDVDAALARPDVDAVTICSEYYRHARLILRTLQADKHLLLDKQPLGMTSAEGCAVLAAARSAAQRGIRFTYMHHVLDRTIRRAREQILAGQIGTPRAISASLVVTYGPGDDPDTSPTSRYGRGFHPQWWSHGELMHHGGYAIGMVLALMGSAVTSVYATTGAYFNRIHRDTGIEDWAVLSLGFANGGVGTIVTGRAPNGAALDWGDHMVQVVGTQGSLSATDPLSLQAAGAQRGMSQRLRFGTDTHGLVIDDWVEAILHGTPLAQDHEDGFAELQVLLAGFASIQAQRSVALP